MANENKMEKLSDSDTNINNYFKILGNIAKDYEQNNKVENNKIVSKTNNYVKSNGNEAYDTQRNNNLEANDIFSEYEYRAVKAIEKSLSEYQQNYLLNGMRSFYRGTKTDRGNKRYRRPTFLGAAGITAASLCLYTNYAINKLIEMDVNPDILNFETFVTVMGASLPMATMGCLLTTFGFSTFRTKEGDSFSKISKNKNNKGLKKAQTIIEDLSRFEKNKKLEKIKSKYLSLHESDLDNFIDCEYSENYRDKLVDFAIRDKIVNDLFNKVDNANLEKQILGSDKSRPVVFKYMKKQSEAKAKTNQMVK